MVRGENFVALGVFDIAMVINDEKVVGGVNCFFNPHLMFTKFLTTD
jgi:hypothetical protein